MTQTGTLTNTATVTTAQASEPNPDNNSAQDVNLQAALVLTKTGCLNMAVVTPADLANVGDVISYTLVATNTGGITLTNVSITDLQLRAIVCTLPVTLAPGAAITCWAPIRSILDEIVSGTGGERGDGACQRTPVCGGVHCSDGADSASAGTVQNWRAESGDDGRDGFVHL